MTIIPSSLAETAAALQLEQIDLREYITELCDRIDRIDPDLQALLPEPGRRARLLAEAAALAERYPNPVARPPLYGIAVGVKDIFHVAGFPTRAGSALPPALLAGDEGGCVRALRGAGALILGKTVTTEFAYFEPGPTRNPHSREHTPGGSSSGSAAAVAAGLCPLAIGSQTIGSVIRPAAFCGVVGLKPSYGRIPADGCIPYAPSVDHVGLFTPDTAGMVLAAAAVYGSWRSAQVLAVQDEHPVLAVPEGPYLAQASPAALAAFAAQVERLRAAGYTVRRLPALADIAAIALRHEQLIAAELAAVHATWFQQHADLYRPRTAAQIRKGQQVGAAELAAGRASCGELRAALEARMDAEGIDLWVSPAATGPAPRGLHATGDPAMNLPWTHAGMPALALPAGRAANGLPLGLQVVARFGADESLLGWAAGLAVALDA